MIVNVAPAADSIAASIAGLSNPASPVQMALSDQMADAICSNGDVAFTASDRAKTKGRRGS
jgi:hypothetical protein